MGKVVLTVNGKEEDLGNLWVHVQVVHKSQGVPYVVRLDRSSIDYVFDAENDKNAEVSWDVFLREETAELGSGMLSIYFDKMGDLVGAVQKRPRWVICTLDSVLETSYGLELHGRAVKFKPERFPRP